MLDHRIPKIINIYREEDYSEQDLIDKDYPFHKRCNFIPGYLTLRHFGSLYDVTIDGTSMGKLIKVIELSEEGQTKATEDAVEDGYAISYLGENSGHVYENYKWHVFMCARKIDEYLKEKGYYETFYKLPLPKLRKDFINIIYQMHMVEKIWEAKKKQEQEDAQ